MNIYEKLNCICVEIKAPKSQFNTFADFKFRSIEDIYIYLKPLLFKYKLALIPTDIIEEINGVNYVKTRLTLINSEKTDEIINTVAYAREPAEPKPKMDASQTTLSAATFARKSALCNLFLIDDSMQSTAEALNFPPVTPPPVCSVCGLEIPNVGETTAAQIAKASKQKYGAVMCKACCDTKRRMQAAETAPAEKPEPKAEPAPATPTAKPKGRPPKAK